MVDDQQTHSFPPHPEGVAKIGLFLGYATADLFREEINQQFESVQRHYSGLLENRPAIGTRIRLKFETDSPDPDTSETLIELGYKNPETVWNIVQNWRRR